jgi:hypothetical protein
MVTKIKQYRTYQGGIDARHVPASIEVGRYYFFANKASVDPSGAAASNFYVLEP